MLTRWSDVAVTEPGFGIVSSWEKRRASLEACFGKFAELWQQRAAAPPANDLISLMVHSDGTKDLSPEEFLGNLINIIVGGNDTTSNSLSGAVLAFDSFPEQWQRLRADPTLAATAAPEIIRWQTPISHVARTALADFTIRDTTIRKGDRVAELQLQIAWEEIARRFSRVEIVGEPIRVCSNIIHGYRELPVRFHR